MGPDKMKSREITERERGRERGRGRGKKGGRMIHRLGG